MQYKVTVNDTSEFQVSEESASSLDASLMQSGKYHILQNNISYSAEIISHDFLQKEYTIRVNGNLYTVAIKTPLDHLIKDMGFETAGSKQVNAIKAPMPGLIIDISVSVGQYVSKNDPMIILGAMKMENSFLAPRDGLIKNVLVNKGDAVEKGQLLIEFE